MLGQGQVFITDEERQRPKIIEILFENPLELLQYEIDCAECVYIK